MDIAKDRRTDGDTGGLLMRALWTRLARRTATRGRTDEEREYYALSEGVYAKFAGPYDMLVRPMRRLRRRVVDLSRAGGTASVIDVATGGGEQARAFAVTCSRVIGVDLSDAMLRVARAKKPLPGLSFLQGDATALPFDEASFDVATISFALHEMPASIRETVLGEMIRVTKPGGTVVVVDWGLPPGPLASRLVYGIVRFFEDARYAEFVRLDLGRLLATKGIEVSAKQPALLGAALVVVGTKVH
jgi:ubiquinone/menaquinone biosynthesis C-methylase UbiE